VKPTTVIICTGLAAAILLAPGCRGHEGPYAGRSYQDFSENLSSYFYDKDLAKAVAIDGQQYARLSNGALQVQTIVRNRTDQLVVIECSTEFKDANNFAIGDTTGWEVIHLQPRAGVTYTSLSTSTRAEKFTVRIRPVQK